MEVDANLMIGEASQYLVDKAFFERDLVFESNLLPGGMCIFFFIPEICLQVDKISF